MDQPQIRRRHPPNLSISLSGGRETNRDSLSSGERTGKSSSSKSERPSAVPNCSLAGGHCWCSPLDSDPLEQGAMEGESPV